MWTCFAEEVVCEVCEAAAEPFTEKSMQSTLTHTSNEQLQVFLCSEPITCDGNMTCECTNTLSLSLHEAVTHIEVRQVQILTIDSVQAGCKHRSVGKESEREIKVEDRRAVTILKLSPPTQCFLLFPSSQRVKLDTLGHSKSGVKTELEKPPLLFSDVCWAQSLLSTGGVSL